MLLTPKGTGRHTIFVTGGAKDSHDMLPRFLWTDCPRDGSRGALPRVEIVMPADHVMRVTESFA